MAPDPTLTSTSVDGGVMFGTLAAGTFTVSASKAPFTYAPVTFRVQDDIGLCIASPPARHPGHERLRSGMP